MKHGTFRTVTSATESALSVGTDPRKLIITSDTSRLYVAESTTTNFIVGGTRCFEHATATAPGTHWAFDGGTTTAASVTTFTTVYGGRPFVGLSDFYGGVGTVPYVPVIHSISGTSFLASLHSISAGAWGVGQAGGLVWASLGTVSD
jgi:hypothetical protein